MLIFTRESQLYDLKKILDESFTLKLYVNDIEPGYLSKVNDFVEPNRYQPQELLPDKWKFSILDNGKPAGVYPKVSFTFDVTGELVYGFFVVTKTGVLKCADRFVDGPYSILRSGDAVAVTLKMGLGVLIDGYRR
jgi:hypothetical protein